MVEAGVLQLSPPQNTNFNPSSDFVANSKARILQTGSHLLTGLNKQVKHNKQIHGDIVPCRRELQTPLEPQIQTYTPNNKDFQRNLLLSFPFNVKSLFHTGKESIYVSLVPVLNIPIGCVYIGERGVCYAAVSFLG